ncbi:MAG: molybdopterin molybdotransferase MoeA [Pyrinomonadaceae bacterium]|nr:molybdopterin molybdotransferase MoeA [Acidobacteriota bacterium]MBK7933887.1 molybdopterin molybdotransferase MoeA [Acidobacteriota bacterium]MBP7375771.1 molybdopterin molybdotransferase MoeA [Pyrinomonadaceae bacterium]
MTMIAVKKAQNIITRETGSLGSERITIANAVGRVLSETIVADSDLPPFDRSQMDGYAVVAKDTLNASVTLDLVGESAAGRGWHHELLRGQAVAIMTGAPVPKGADAVQKIELTRLNNERSVEILEPTEKGRYIIRKGDEIKKGETIFRAGEVVTENMIAAIAAFGYAKVKVAKQPQVAILGTGSEIVEISNKPGRDQIRNSNSAMLEILSRKFGGSATILPIAKDDISDLKFHISKAAKRTDILVITGGVSVGKYDHTKTALSELGAELFFEKVRLKPGKPAVFARLGKCLVFGLPGNPVSAAVTFHLFVRQALLQMQKAADPSADNGSAVLATDTRGARERDTYLPAGLSTNELGQLIAHPLKWSGSSDFVGFSRARALVLVPQGAELAKGSVAKILYL